MSGGGITAIATPTKVVTPAMAENALRKYRRDGTDVDPQNVDQVNAYIALRRTNSRCNAEQFVAYFKSLENKVTHGAGATQVFWAVPKCNFVNGLPDRIERFRKAADACDGFIVDHEHYWVVDQCITQPELGGDVYPIHKFLST